MLSKTCSEVKAGLEGPCIQHIENTCLCLDCSESGDCLLCPKHGCPVYPQDHNFIADVEFQGNNGGDYVKISQTVGQSKESCLNIEVGHCCVVTLRAVVPVEFLTSLITKFMFTDTEGMSRATDDKRNHGRMA